MPKPLIIGDAKMTAERSEAINKQLRQHDASYVEGYSDVKKQNERRIARGEDPIPQDRLQWIRISRLDGGDISIDEMHLWASLGYQLVYADPATGKSKDLEERGWKMPPTAYVDAVGRVRRADTALAIVDFEQAEVNRRRQRELNKKFHSQPDKNLQQFDTGGSRQEKMSMEELRGLVDD